MFNEIRTRMFKPMMLEKNIYIIYIIFFTNINSKEATLEVLKEFNFPITIKKKNN